MPTTRACKDLSVAVQTQLQFPVRRKTRNSEAKKLLQQKEVPNKAQKNVERNTIASNGNVFKSPLKQIQCNSPMKSPFKDSSNTQHTNVASPGKRKLFIGKENSSPSKISKKIGTTKSTIKSIKKLKEATQNRRNSQSFDSSYNEVRTSLHTSIPKNLVSREKEFELIKKFVNKTIVQSEPGSMYMSGAPGTGKTACLTTVLDQCKECKKLPSIFLNCMALKLSQNIFVKLAQEFSATSKPMTIKDSIKFLESKFTSAGPRILLILDEIDQLESKNQEVLYKLFEMPFLPKSRLVLIGIANALDLTDRILPRLQSKSTCKPVLLQFPPYSKDEIHAILKERVKESNSDVIEPTALLFCARKVSAMSGDVRKALDILRRAVEIVEQDSSKSNVSPSSTGKRKVTVGTINSVCAEVYGSKVTNTSGIQNGFPLQQKIIVCTLMILMKDKKIKETTISKLYEAYCRICTSRHIASVGQEEINGICTLLETQGIVAFKKSKDRRNEKISLRLQENELEHALQDKILVSSILNAGLPIAS